MSTWQRPNDGDFSDRQRTRTDWEMPGMDFPRVQHTQGNRRRTFKQNLRVNHSATHGDKREAFSDFFIADSRTFLKEFSQRDTFISELDVSPWNKLLQSEKSELDVEKTHKMDYID